MSPMKHTMNLNGLAEGWTGHLILEAPLHTERLRAITGMKLHKMAGTGGKKGAKEIDALFDEQLPALLDLYEKHARKLIQEVVISGPGGEKIETVEDFDRHPATGQCFAEVAVAYVFGFGPGKKKN